jgi:hypothetical protein
LAEKFLLVFQTGLPLPSQFVDKPKTRIVAGLFVFFAGVTQAND